MKRTILFVATLLLIQLLAPNRSHAQIPRGHFTDVQAVAGLNGSTRDQTPWVSDDGLSIYFSSDRSNPGGSFPNAMDIWTSTRDSVDGPFDPPVLVESPVSHDGLADCCMYLTNDQLTMYVSSRWPGTGSRDSDIWKTTRQDAESAWGQLENMEGINVPDAADWGPTMTPDGLHVIFSSGRDGGSTSNLFKASRSAVREDFGPASALNINTRWKDKNPSLSSDGRIVFFDSSRDGGTGPDFGPGDLWLAARSSPDDPFGEAIHLDVLNDGSARNRLNTSWTEDDTPFISRDWPATGSKLYWVRIFNGTDWDLYEATWTYQGLDGDFNFDDRLDNADLDFLVSQSRSGLDLRFYDLNGDDAVDANDMTFWVHDVKQTWLGDANLDGEFNSSDLVAVFAAGQFEDNIADNSTWATGDWNFDGEFDSSDFVTAFQDGGYEKGPLQIANVPEPTPILMPLFGAILGLLFQCRVRAI